MNGAVVKAATPFQNVGSMRSALPGRVGALAEVEERLVSDDEVRGEVGLRVEDFAAPGTGDADAVLVVEAGLDLTKLGLEERLSLLEDLGLRAHRAVREGVPDDLVGVETGHSAHLSRWIGLIDGE